MDRLWLLKGDYDAPGWKLLEKEAKAKEVDWVIFDRDAWALIRAEEEPTKYEGLTPSEPQDGLYLDHQGNAVAVFEGKLIPGPDALIEALGDEAKALLEKLGDPLKVIERLGKSY